MISVTSGDKEPLFVRFNIVCSHILCFSKEAFFYIKSVCKCISFDQFTIFYSKNFESVVKRELNKEIRNNFLRFDLEAADGSFLQKNCH